MSASRPMGSAEDGADEPSTGVRAESEARLRQLFDEHYGLVWRSVRRFGVPASDVDDAAQEVFIVAARRIEDIASGKERAFLLGTAARVASEARRARRRRPEDPSADAALLVDRAPKADESLDHEEARRLLDRVLDEMSEEQRVVFVLFELEEMTMAAIADSLQLPPGTIASRLRRARERFEASARRIQATHDREAE